MRLSDEMIMVFLAGFCNWNKSIDGFFEFDYCSNSNVLRSEMTVRGSSKNVVI